MITIFLVLPWALERRRRPEVDVLWEISMSVSPEDLRHWEPDQTIELKPGQQVLVAASIRNVGDRQGDSTQINLVVPKILGIGMELEDATRVEPMDSRNGTAGIPPSFAVKYLNILIPSWTPGNWFSIQFRLWVPDEFKAVADTDARILFAISDLRFNGTGRRWLPSLLSKEQTLASPAGTVWPPRARTVWKRTPQWVHAQPNGRVLCRTGERQDIRDVRVTASGMTGPGSPSIPPAPFEPPRIDREISTTGRQSENETL